MNTFPNVPSSTTIKHIRFTKMAFRRAACFDALIVKTNSFQSSTKMSSSLRSLASSTLYAGRGISVSEILKSPQWPEKWPFTARDFSRQVIFFACD